MFQKAVCYFFCIFGLVALANAEIKQQYSGADYIAVEGADNVSNISSDNISDNLTDEVYNEDLFKKVVDDNVTDEESANEWLKRYYEDIFIFNDVAMSMNIPSSYFFKARLIHNNTEISEYQKRAEFYYLTIGAIDDFFSYAVELVDGARDIENCEDEVEAMLAFLQIINANEFGYRDLVQPETLYKIDEIFMMIDVVVKKQIARNMGDKPSLASVYEAEVDEYDMNDFDLERYYPTLYSLRTAKMIHQSKISAYEKKRKILYLLIDELQKIDNRIATIRKDYDKGMLNEYQANELGAGLGFMQVIADNKHDYRELVSGDDIELLGKLIYQCEVMLGLKQEVIVYVDVVM